MLRLERAGVSARRNSSFCAAHPAGMKRRQQPQPTHRSTAPTCPTPTSFDEHRIAQLHAEIAALLPEFEHIIDEEDRLYDEIHGLQEQIHVIQHRDVPEGTHLIYPEVSEDPITITVRSPFEEKKIRFRVGNYGTMKLAGCYPYVGILAKFIANALAAGGADVTVDPHRTVSVLTQESRIARLRAWADTDRAAGEQEDEES